MHRYLTDKKLRTKKDNSLSNFIDLFISVELESILDLLLINTYICDLFIFIEEENVMSYANDAKPYFNGNSVVTVLVDIKSNERFLTGSQ